MNLWQREVVKKLELWKLAKGENIYYSGFILKELKYILSEEEFNQKRELFNSNKIFIRETLTKEEYEFGRKLELDLKNKLSFFDILHFLLARKTNSILITRDNKLIEISNELGVEAKKPEEVL